jgi:hypothetical protein
MDRKTLKQMIMDRKSQCVQGTSADEGVGYWLSG